ncbi:hypothetical protein V5799_006893 [Amblyomma americanum]|uniref:Uncharacterized protein n=1 Tax=Amblyomma americanum TaxID=6943 RepID=A0AAQ4DV36_AMBAM
MLTQATSNASLTRLWPWLRACSLRRGKLLQNLVHHSAAVFQRPQKRSWSRKESQGSTDNDQFLTICRENTGDSLHGQTTAV